MKRGLAFSLGIERLRQNVKILAREKPKER